MCSHLLAALRNLKSSGNSTVTSMSVQSMQQSPETEQKTNVKPTGQIKCYNCNDFRHISAKCTQPQRKPKCTSCSKIGHNAKDCKVKPIVMAIDNDNIGDKPVTKTFIVNGKQFEAFIDTGSICSLIRTTAKGMQAQHTNKRFIGFGRCEVHASEKLEVHGVMGNVQRLVIYLVGDNIIPCDILLGRDALKDYGYRLANDHDILQINSIENDFNLSSQISSKEKGEVSKPLLAYQDCFSEDIQQIGRCKNTQISIEVTTSKPILGKRYQVPFAQRH
ncbi:uncharacterized protein [Eurosta solidaginis]|uniref:uncharacterized protein n=1 Tax=Eurosta solidaginis TaxID=178769 RepID=UPI003530C7B5